jgi:hypothetical protein
VGLLPGEGDDETDGVVIGYDTDLLGAVAAGAEATRPERGRPGPGRIDHSRADSGEVDRLRGKERVPWGFM